MPKVEIHEYDAGYLIGIGMGVSVIITSLIISAFLATYHPDLALFTATFIVLCLFAIRIVEHLIDEEWFNNIRYLPFVVRHEDTDKKPFFPYED